MKTKWMVGIFLATFIVSVAFGVLLNWSDVRGLMRKYSASDAGMVWLEAASDEGGLHTLPSPLHFVSLPQNLADYRDLGSEKIQSIFASQSLVVVGTKGGGVSISSDNAASWYTATISNGLSSNNVYSTFVEGERIYVGTENGLSWTDTMGRKWETRTAENGLGLGVSRVVSVFARDQKIFAGTLGSGLKASQDGGKTWYSASEKGLDAGNVLGIVASEDSFFAATEKGLFVSRDAGESWRRKNEDDELDFVSRGTLSLSVCDGNVYVGTKQGLFKSAVAKNEKWTELSFSGWPPHSGVLSVAAFKRERDSECTVAVSLAGAGLGQSQNAGRGWTFFGDLGSSENSGDSQNDDFFAVALTNDKLFAGGPKSGLIVADKLGGNLRKSGAPRAIRTSPVTNIVVEGNSIFGATHDGVVISNDAGSSWETKRVVPSESEKPNSISFVSLSSGKILAAAHNALCQALFDGVLWQCSNASTFGFGESDGTLTGVAQQDDLVVVSSQNGGISISKKGWAGPWTQKGVSDIAQLHVNQVRIVDGKIFVAARSALSISADGGDSWRKMTFGESYMSGVAAEDKMIAVALHGSGLALSLDAGNSWRLVRVMHGLADDIVNDVAISRGSLFVATAKGLSVSHNFGKTWYTSTVANGVASNNIVSVAIAGNRVYVGTDVGVSFVELSVK